MLHSYSRLNSFANCPRQYKYRYIDHLKVIPNQDATNALYLGNAIHTAFETGDMEAGINEYLSHYNVLTDEIINEEIKLRHWIPQVLEVLPPGDCEVEIKTNNFVGYIDRLVPLHTDANGVKHYEVWDYKYCNERSKTRYLDSPQLGLYKYYFELTHPNCVVDRLVYVFIPKVAIRQKHKAKPPETIIEFRQRLQEHMKVSNFIIVPVEYDSAIIPQFESACQSLEQVKNFPKNETRLCDFCDYKEYCQSNEKTDYMIIKKGE